MNKALWPTPIQNWCCKNEYEITFDTFEFILHAVELPPMTSQKLTSILRVVSEPAIPVVELFNTARPGLDGTKNIDLLISTVPQ